MVLLQPGIPCSRPNADGIGRGALCIMLLQMAFADFGNTAGYRLLLLSMPVTQVLHREYSLLHLDLSIDTSIAGKHDGREERREYLLAFQQEKYHLYNIQ
jgi:hypothetical protein